MVQAGLKGALGGGVADRSPMSRRLADYVALTKPRPMSVVAYTGLAGLVAGTSSGSMTLAGALSALAAIALGGGGAAVLNMWFERDLDRRMVRTSGRPIAAGRVAPHRALVFALALIAISLALMHAAAGGAAMAMLAATIFFYAVVYTMWLKRATPLNVVIGGGLASVLTPLTGWVAATGSLSVEALAIFAFLLPWTPPHVWSQALVRSEDYANAGVPMMPVVVGPARTLQLIAASTVLHAIVALVPVAMGFVGWVWATAAVAGGVLLCASAWRHAARGHVEGAAARAGIWRFYRMNSLYVVALLTALVVERAFGLESLVATLAPHAG